VAANDDFPRGWLSSVGVGTTGTPATIIIPAVAGVAHVVTDVDATIAYGGGAFGSYVWTYYNPGTGNVTCNYGYLFMESGGKDEYSWSGKIAVPLDTILTVSFQEGCPAGGVETLTVQGYDI
jgi:hypothetical protein